MAKLLILSGKRKGAEIELPGEGEVVDIGNRDSAMLAIHDPWISFNHAQIKLINGRYLIEDQGSSNGTWVLKGSNAERVERHELSSEDVFALGNTRVRFVGEEASAPATPEVPAPAPPAKEKPWWDKVVEDEGSGKSDGNRVRLLKRELAEEKRMRLALEKFLDLPVGATVGDASKAGELEVRVRELETQLEKAKESAKSGVLPQGNMLNRHTEKLRRGHMSELVSLEGRATTAEAKVADLEGRLRERGESSKKERSEQRTEIERLQHEIDELKASGGDPSVTVDDRLSTLKDELAEVRKDLSSTEEQRKDLEAKLRESEDSSVDKSDVEGLKAELKAALEQVAHHKGEQARVLQELDDVSMEQIEIEERLQGQIKTLEAQLRDAGLVPEGGDAPAKSKKKKKKATGKSKRKTTKKRTKKKPADEPTIVAPPAEPTIEAPDSADSASAAESLDVVEEAADGESKPADALDLTDGLDLADGESLELATEPKDEADDIAKGMDAALDQAASQPSDQGDLPEGVAGESTNVLLAAEAAKAMDEALDLAAEADDGEDELADSGELEFNPLMESEEI